MAIYDFKCLDCKVEWEDMLTKTVKPQCPKCHSLKCEILLFTKAPILKGAAQERIKNRANNPQTEPSHFYINRHNEDKNN